jgi:proteasome assembly chaperone (PAC2) family protein
MAAPDSTQWILQLVWLFVLAIPIACVAWTVTHEEIFREPREYCVRRSQDEGSSLIARKFFYLFTCEYCFSHYVTMFFLVLTGYKLLLDDWRGYLISLFALVAVANAYMGAFGRLRQEVKSEKLEAKRKEKVLEKVQKREQEQEQEQEGPPAEPARTPVTLSSRSR